jgi:hypothetical protein
MRQNHPGRKPRKTENKPEKQGLALAKNCDQKSTKDAERKICKFDGSSFLAKFKKL